jgi:hypothetical protein
MASPQHSELTQPNHPTNLLALQGLGCLLNIELYAALWVIK